MSNPTITMSPFIPPLKRNQGKIQWSVINGLHLQHMHTPQTIRDKIFYVQDSGSLYFFYIKKRVTLSFVNETRTVTRSVIIFYRVRDRKRCITGNVKMGITELSTKNFKLKSSIFRKIQRHNPSYRLLRRVPFMKKFVGGPQSSPES